MAGIYSQGGSAGHRYAGWLSKVEAKNFHFGGKVFNGSPSAIYVGSKMVWKDSPYDLLTTAFFKETYPDYWPQIKAYGKEHPEMIPEIEANPDGWGSFISYYQQVEYIETQTSTINFSQYGIIGSYFCMKVKLQFLEAGAISGTRRAIVEYNSSYGMGYWFAWSGQGGIAPKYKDNAATKMYEWDLNRPQNYAKLDGTKVNNFGINSTFDSENQVFCFGARQGYSSGNKKQRIAYLEFYGSTNAILYPCYKKDDGKLGMFDVVNKSFVNFGSGDWSADTPWTPPTP